MEEYNMQTKIRKSGNSYVVTIPPKVMEESNLNEGDVLEIETGRETLGMKKAKNILTPEFFSKVESLADEYEDMLEKLVDM
jgi:putative addiction module antidote